MGVAGTENFLHVKRTLALFCENVWLKPGCGMFGQVLVVKVEYLLVDHAAAELCIQFLAMS